MRYNSSGGSENRSSSKAERPVDEIRFGRCKVVVWVNQTKNGEMLSFVPTRLYRDGEEWKESSSFGVADLLPMAEAFREAFRRASAPTD